MELIRILLLGITLFSGLLLLAGLISPVLVLWWMDSQNRLRVLRLYGSMFLIALICYLLIRGFA